MHFENLIRRFYWVRRTYYGLERVYKELSQKIREYLKANYHYLDEKNQPVWEGKEFRIRLESVKEEVVDPGKFIKKVGLKKALPFIKISKEEVKGKLSELGIDEKEFNNFLKIQEGSLRIKIEKTR